MNSSEAPVLNVQLVRRWQRWSLWSAVIVVILGGIGLAGWLFDLYLLKSFFSYSAVMKMDTAFSIVLSGTAVILFHYNYKSLSRVIAVLVLVLSFTNVIENIFSLHLLDDFFRQYSSGGNEGPPSTARLIANVFGAVLTLALVMFAFEWFNAARVLAIAVLIFIYGAILGQIFGDSQSVERISGMAIHTALSFLFGSLSLLFYRADIGWMRILSSSYLGGMVGRLTFTYLIVVSPVFIGSFLYIVRMEGVNPSEAIILLVIILSVITLPLAFLVVQRLNVLDSRLHETNEQLKLSNTELVARNEELIAVTENLKVSNDDLSELTRRLSDTTDELSHKNLELIRSNEDLDNIVHIVSHDLKTPLTSLDASVRLFEQKLAQRLAEQEGQLLSMIKRSVVRLKTTIVDLTQALKSQKTMGEAQENVLIHEVLTEVINSLEQDIARAEAEIRFELNAAMVNVVRLHLQSILHNLLSNALKYRSFDRKLEIDVRSDKVENGIELSVSDNGLGIPANKLPQLFSMFKRFHTHVEGTGIGLYIVKRIVENNHGRIHVDSEVGRGTRFTIVFNQAI
ncbi:MAG TPA: MFS domain-containing histidine kinase [Sphingobacteriaceae bacterium]